MDGRLHGRDGKTYKKGIKMIVKDRSFTEEALSTSLTVVECIINSRFFTYNSDDIGNCEPIT